MRHLSNLVVHVVGNKNLRFEQNFYLCWHIYYYCFRYYDLTVILFRAFGFLSPMYFLMYLTFQTLEYEGSWWWLFQKRVLCTKLDIQWNLCDPTPEFSDICEFRQEFQVPKYFFNTLSIPLPVTSDIRHCYSPSVINYI